MTIPLAYLNGRFLPVTEASLPLHDAGFVMGATVTDLCRTFKRDLFRWDDHLQRFRRDCDACFIPLLKTDKQLTATAKKLIAHNRRLLVKGQELALITFATPGAIGYYLGEQGGAGDGAPTLGMHTFPLPFERYRRFFTEGVALATPSSQDISPAGSFARSKHRSRLHWWAADRRLKEDGRPAGTVALGVSPKGDLTETAIGHLLLVQQGTVVTPRRMHVLDGISLRVVAELCGDLNIPHADTDLNLFQACNADEAMLCGTAFCLAGVSRINDSRIPWPGPVFTRLLAAWSERVGLDIARQFLPNP